MSCGITAGSSSSEAPLHAGRRRVTTSTAMASNTSTTPPLIHRELLEDEVELAIKLAGAKPDAEADEVGECEGEALGPPAGDGEGVALGHGANCWPI